MNQKIHIIVAVGKGNRVIGNKGKIPWHIPADFKRFKEITSGHPIIMGKRTFESIGKPLSDRTNIVLSREAEEIAGCVTCPNIENALEIAKKSPGGEDVFIIGGAKVYEQFMNLADILHLTIVHGNFEGDTFFPDYKDFKIEKFKEEHLENSPAYTFIDLTKN